MGFNIIPTENDKMNSTIFAHNFVIVTHEKLLECGFAVEIVSTLQQDFFLETMSVDSSQLSTTLTISTRSLDAGATQLDPLQMDIMQTLKNYFENIHSNYSVLLDQEVQFLSLRKPDIVLVDATPNSYMRRRVQSHHRIRANHDEA